MMRFLTPKLALIHMFVLVILLSCSSGDSAGATGTGNPAPLASVSFEFNADPFIVGEDDRSALTPAFGKVAVLPPALNLIKAWMKIEAIRVYKDAAAGESAETFYGPFETNLFADGENRVVGQFDIPPGEYRRVELITDIDSGSGTVLNMEESFWLSGVWDFSGSLHEFEIQIDITDPMKFIALDRNIVLRDLDSITFKMSFKPEMWFYNIDFEECFSQNDSQLGHLDVYHPIPACAKMVEGLKANIRGDFKDVKALEWE